MKVMISMPMNGIPDEEVKEQYTALTKTFEEAGYEVVLSLLDQNVTGVKHAALMYLGKSIQIMANVDAVYFAPGWEEARGCAIEHEACTVYGVDIIDEIPKPINKILFEAEKLEVGDTIIFYNGDHKLVESIQKCPCHSEYCDVLYINDHISTYYDSIQYIIKKEEKPDAE